MTFIDWILTGLVVWLVGGSLAGILIGRFLREHPPSPNHPAARARAQKQLTTDRPLDPYETAAWAQIEKKLRT